MIANGIKEIEKADMEPTIHLNSSKNWKPSLVVIENGMVRMLPISKKVAEVLIANGMSHGT